MLLTSLTKFTRSEQSNGRYVLAPFVWVFAFLLSLARLAGGPSLLAESAILIVPEDPVEELEDPTDSTDTVDIRPVRPEPTREPRPIRRGSFFADLRQPIDFNYWRVSTYRNDQPGAYYGGPWLLENIIQQHDRLILRVNASVDGAPPTMAEMRTREKYGYGRYEVIMRPSGESGVVSTFFTYTGPWDGDPKDEIDIEFVGKRPTIAEYNYWKNGQTGEYSREPLGFDYSERLNLFAFEWHPDEIIWFVNGEEHYRSPRDASQIPTHPGNIYLSAWTGRPGMYPWTGPPEFGESAQAEYACVSYVPFESDSYSCADLWGEDPQFQREDAADDED
nr:family 16 glycosylhydrolase [Hyphomonas sp. Mor2]